MPDEENQDKEAFAALLKFDEDMRAAGEQRFNELYAENPGLEQYAHDRVVPIVDTALSTLEEITSHPSRDTFIKACKKMVFTFTDPEDFADSIQDYDVERAIVRARALTTNPMEAARALDRMTNYMYILYLPRAMEVCGDIWGNMGPSEQFWYVQGFSEAHMQGKF